MRSQRRIGCRGLYDASNNRTGQTNYTSATAAAITASTFPAAGGANPHQVTQVAVTPAGSSTPITANYSYDKAGNTTSRWTGNAVQAGGSMTKATMTYNKEGRLASTTVGANTINYFYDPSGDQLIRRDNATTTLYLGDVELVLNRATSAITGTRHYQALGRTVATRTGATAAEVAWVFSDLNGTGGWQINAVNSAVTTRRTTPFGSERGSVSAWKGSQGFVGGTIDKDAGFTRVGARDYDTFAGRFLTLDPILDPLSPREWNPYQYGAWNPINSPDPTGLKICLETCDTTTSYASEGAPRPAIKNTYDRDNGPGNIRKPGPVRNPGRPGADFRCIDSCGSRAEYGRRGITRNPSGAAWVEPFVFTVQNASAYAAPRMTQSSVDLPDAALGDRFGLRPFPYHAFDEFRKYVKAGGPGDYKYVWNKSGASQGATMIDSLWQLEFGDGTTLDYDVFGNVAYGYTGTRINIDYPTLIVAQLGAAGGHLTREDMNAITFGVALANKYPAGISSQQLYAEVQAASKPGGILAGSVHGR